jgi:uncharacterized protein involved in propanediol utilization
MAKPGIGHASGHFGEIAQGALRRAESGPGPEWDEVVVTLPAPIFRCTATFALRLEPGIAVTPRHCAKAAHAARLALDHLGARDRGGRLELRNDAPSGGGGGSSTMDVVAAIRAVADALSVAVSDDEVSQLAVAAEGASDPLMFAAAPARLYAFHTGRTLAELPGSLPRFYVLGFSDGGPVDSLAIGPRRFSSALLDRYARLFASVRRAIETGDTALVAEAATQSAELNERLLPKPSLPACIRLVERGIAAGVAVAHSGNLVGLLFPAAAPSAEERMAEATRSLVALGVAIRYRFATGGAPIASPAR